MKQRDHGWPQDKGAGKECHEKKPSGIGIDPETGVWLAVMKEGCQSLKVGKGPPLARTPGSRHWSKGLAFTAAAAASPGDAEDEVKQGEAQTGAPVCEGPVHKSNRWDPVALEEVEKGW